jgi:hypothetical protein
VLADALAYADTTLDPDVVVDVATLTGAATRGLGRGHAALFANDDRLAQALTRAGDSSGERVWRMPLVEDYRPLIDSDVADLCHVATTPKAGAGAVVAALFLREFTGGRSWAHLDIAGPGRSERDNGLVNRGGTGFGARLLRPGGLVAFDNALWHDRVADPAQRDEETTVIRDLGKEIAANDSLVPVLLPVGDGLLVAKKEWAPEA